MWYLLRQFYTLSLKNFFNKLSLFSTQFELTFLMYFTSQGNNQDNSSKKNVFVLKQEVLNYNNGQLRRLRNYFLSKARQNAHKSFA